MLIPSGYAQVNYRYQSQAVPNGAEVTLGLDVSQATLEGDALASALFDAWGEVMANGFTTSTTVVECSVKMGPNSTGPTYVDSGSISGTGSGDAVSPNVSVLVNKLTGIGGRQGRGRMFLPGLAESEANVGGVISPTTRGDIENNLASFVTELNALGVAPALLRSPDSPISAPAPIIGFTVQSVLATQRRRLRR